jgi:ATP-dependent 26S proteasome regulatory subunit
MKSIAEIESLIKARYELIYVNTFEEVRVTDDIVALAANVKMKLGVWTFASGLKMIETTTESTKGPEKKKDLDIDDAAGNPLEILRNIMLTTEDTIFVLKDYHTFLKDAEVVRMLKDTLQTMKSAYTPIVILAPVVQLPIEIENETAVVDYSLPNEEDISNVIDIVVENTGIDAEEINREEIIKSCRGLTFMEIENVLSKSIVLARTLDPKTILTEKKQIIRKNGLLEYIDTEETMDNIGGVSNLKEWLSQRRVAFTDKAREFGLPVPKGLILTGIQGCGKSLVCKAASNMMNLPLLKLDMGSVMQSLVGSSEENIRNVLKVASAVAPCILWIDEIEKGLSGVASSNFSDGGTTSRVFAYLLNWLQEKKEPVFVLATANDLTMLSPELLRAGRFDDMFFVDLPSPQERMEIFKIHLAKRGRQPEKFDLSLLAMSSEGYSGAEIEQSIVDAMFDVYVKDMGTRDISTESILAALKRRVPLSVVKRDQIRKLREKANEIAKPAN